MKHIAIIRYAVCGAVQSVADEDWNYKCTDSNWHRGSSELHRTDSGDDDNGKNQARLSGLSRKVDKEGIKKWHKSGMKILTA